MTSPPSGPVGPQTAVPVGPHDALMTDLRQFFHDHMKQYPQCNCRVYIVLDACDALKSLTRELQEARAEIERLREHPCLESAYDDLLAERDELQTELQEVRRLIQGAVSACSESEEEANAVLEMSKRKRAELWPTDDLAVRGMCSAYQRLRELGWRDEAVWNAARAALRDGETP